MSKETKKLWALVQHTAKVNLALSWSPTLHYTQSDLLKVTAQRVHTAVYRRVLADVRCLADTLQRKHSTESNYSAYKTFMYLSYSTWVPSL